MSATDSDFEHLGVEWDYDLTSGDSDRIEVSGQDNDMVRANSGELAVEGLSKCLGIAVYDHSSEMGYAAHFVTVGDEDQLLENMQDFNFLLKTDDVDYNNSEIMVAGIDYGEDITDMFLGDNDEVDEVLSQGSKRALAEEYAERYFADSEVCWDVDEGKTSSIVLDIDEGILEHNPSYQDR